jgi:hypothetical protein
MMSIRSNEYIVCLWLVIFVMWAATNNLFWMHEIMRDSIAVAAIMVHWGFLAAIRALPSKLVRLAGS